MDKFEKILREKLQHHEASMPAGEWEKFSQRLDNITPKPNPWKSYLAGGIAAAVIGVGAYFLLPSGQQSPAPQKKAEQATERMLPAETSEKTTTPAGNITVQPAGEGQETINVTETGKVIKETGPEKIKHITRKEVTDLSRETDKKTSITDPAGHKTLNNNNTASNAHDNKNTEQTVSHITPAQVQLPEPEISGNVREVCQHAEISFRAANSRNDHEMIWVLNGEEISADAELKVSFSKPGTQTLQLVYATVHEGKRLIKESEKRFINVLPAPVADIEVNKVNTFSPEYIFKAPVAEGNDYLWNFGDGKVQTGNELTHVYRKKGEYTIALTITGSNGCKARKTQRVEIESDYNLLTPNAFSPNNDGHNDVFISEALKAMPDVRFRMIIFDKSGKKIFETTRLDNPWDGRNSTTGTMCQPDAYVWRVELTRPDGAKEEYMGSVTLLSN